VRINCKCDYRKVSNQGALRAAAEAIRGLPGFTGIALLDPDGPVEIYGTAHELPKLMSAARAAASTGRFRGHKVRNDLQPLFGVQAKITADFSTLIESGFRLYRYWPDMASGLEVVELINATSAETASFERRYGSEFVRAVTVTNPPPIVAHGQRVKPHNDA
jgi:hypothetical protein